MASLVDRTVVAVARWITELQYCTWRDPSRAWMEDYIAAGFDVVEVVGVGASPSCGVEATLDVDGAVAAIGRCDERRLSTAVVNEDVVAANTAAGRGAVRHSPAPSRRSTRIEVPFGEHDLLAELGT